MNQRNYQKELDHIIEELHGGGQEHTPRLLLHSCCAPCSSYVLEYLSRYFEITVYFYNPNIYPAKEYVMRGAEQKRLIEELDPVHAIQMESGAYEPDEFYRMAQGLEQEPEGGKRCVKCYELRLTEAAKVAAAGHYDYFTTTLSISPLKDADKLNEIGEKLAREYRVAYLPSDFKKRDGYKRSVELSALHHLYRQNYCGCVYSRPQKNAETENEKTSRVCLDTSNEL